MEKNEKKIAIENLTELLDVFNIEKTKLEEKIQLNENSILEMKGFLTKIKSTEAEDYKFFSPRDPSALYQDSVIENSNKIETYENENHNLYVEISRYDKKINLIRETLFAVNNINVIVPKAESVIKSDITETLPDENYNTENTENNENVAVKVYETVKFSKLDRKKLTDGFSKMGLYALNVQEKERERIARDLHDSSLQNLTHMIHKIELASKFIDQDTLRAKLELVTITKGLREIIEEIRGTIYNLRPMAFNDLGFVEVFNKIKDNYRLKSSCDIVMDIDDINNCSEIVKITIYRIVDEAVCNAIKHAKASILKVSIKDEGESIHVEIIDNGTGFDESVLKGEYAKSNLHFGLQIMKERIILIDGTMSITNDKGTKIFIDIPKIGGKSND